MTSQQQRNTDAHAFYNSLTPADILARAQAAAAKHDAQGTTGKRGHTRGRVPKATHGVPRKALREPCRDLQAGHVLADTLVRAKGGTLRPLPSYEQYFAEYEAAALPTGETA